MPSSNEDEIGSNEDPKKRTCCSRSCGPVCMEDRRSYTRRPSNSEATSERVSEPMGRPSAVIR